LLSEPAPKAIGFCGLWKPESPFGEHDDLPVVRSVTGICPHFAPKRGILQNPVILRLEDIEKERDQLALI
jgi:hypothetical protein